MGKSGWVSPHHIYYIVVDIVPLSKKIVFCIALFIGFMFDICHVCKQKNKDNNNSNDANYLIRQAGKWAATRIQEIVEVIAIYGAHIIQL